MRNFHIIIFFIIVNPYNIILSQSTETRSYNFVDDTSKNVFDTPQTTKVVLDFKSNILKIFEGSNEPLLFTVLKIHKNLTQGVHNSDSIYLYDAFEIAVIIDDERFDLQARLYQDPYVGFYLMFSQEKFKRYYNKPQK